MRTPNILLVQFRTTQSALESEHQAILRSVGELGNVTARHIFDFNSAGELQDSCLRVDGVIFGGSGDFDLNGGREASDPAREKSQEILKLVEPAIRAIRLADKPFLGICYGHQLVAELFGGCICNNKEQSKFGTHEVDLTIDGRTDPIFQDLPHKFDAQYGHKDSICILPDGATLLASSDKCRGAMLRYGCHLYTTQFHPELTGEDMKARLQNSPEYLPEGTCLDTLARVSHEASKIIPRWCELIVCPVANACE